MQKAKGIKIPGTHTHSHWELRNNNVKRGKKGEKTDIKIYGKNIQSEEWNEIMKNIKCVQIPYHTKPHHTELHHTTLHHVRTIRIQIQTWNAIQRTKINDELKWLRFPVSCSMFHVPYLCLCYGKSKVLWIVLYYRIYTIHLKKTYSINRIISLPPACQFWCFCFWSGDYYDFYTVFMFVFFFSSFFSCLVFLIISDLATPPLNTLFTPFIRRKG